MLVYIGFQVSARTPWRLQHPCGFLESFTLHLSGGRSAMCFSCQNHHWEHSCLDKLRFFSGIRGVTLASALQSSWSVPFFVPFVKTQRSKWEVERRACATLQGLRRSILTISRMSRNQPTRRGEMLAHRCLVLKRFFCLCCEGWGVGRGRHRQRTRGKICEDGARGDKVCYSRRASPNPFERPLRHLRAGSSIARSGPALNPLPAAWNGWRQIPAPRPPLSKRNGGRRGTRGDGGINKRAARV